MNYNKIMQKARRLMEESTKQLLDPPGCTCDPKPQLVNVLHDYYEIEVSASCPAHNPRRETMRMTYDAYIQLRTEYFNGRKRTDDDFKLQKLPADQYTIEQNAEIKTTRIALKNAMWEAKTGRERWKAMLGETLATPVTPISVARAVRKVRHERLEARIKVREAEQAYRMAVELPFLVRWRGRDAAKVPSFAEAARHSGKFDGKFIPFDPGMEVRPIGKFDPFAGMFAGPPRRKDVGPPMTMGTLEYSRRDVEATQQLADRQQKRRKHTSLRDHLREE